jgi:hypothetical protein
MSKVNLDERRARRAGMAGEDEGGEGEGVGEDG